MFALFWMFLRRKINNILKNLETSSDDKYFDLWCLLSIFDSKIAIGNGLNSIVSFAEIL